MSAADRPGTDATLKDLLARVRALEASPVGDLRFDFDNIGRWIYIAGNGPPPSPGLYTISIGANDAVPGSGGLQLFSTGGAVDIVSDYVVNIFDGFGSVPGDLSLALTSFSLGGGVFIELSRTGSPAPLTSFKIGGRTGTAPANHTVFQVDSDGTVYMFGLPAVAGVSGALYVDSGVVKVSP